ncbi:PHP domain-containing protein [Legionella massiliensis]|nr:PHP domain-containing protein [Legionella massiliensis]
MIDLHCHSHFSDGKLSPEALIDKALESNVQILALTDHDTVAGLKSLHEAASNHPIQIINGIELSTRWKKYDIHIIGLNIEPENEELVRLIKQQSESRINRALEIAEKMRLCGLENAYEKACELAGHRRVGRPHFAQVLINEGLASDMQSAFKRYLARGRPAYIPTPWISVPEAVQGIIAAEGQAVIAHPLKYKLTRTKLQTLISEFKEAGGTGMEVISGEMTTTQIQEMVGLCMRYQLLASTGSDYHGDTLSRIPLGRQQQLPLNCMPVWQQWIR